MKHIFLPLLTLAALAACDSNPPETGDATETPVPAPAEAVVPPMQSPVAGAIPAAIQGRWGMVAADCEPGRSDAKGLLTITADKLEFYESVGTLDEIEEIADARIRAEFDFTGEGMTWNRDVVLEVLDGGRTLIRQEYGDDAVPDPFRYSRCE